MGFLAAASPARRLRAAIAILRPHNMLGTAAAVLCGYYLAGGNRPAQAGLALVVTAFVTGLGNVINDYYDLEIDRINKPHRPLPSGVLAPQSVLAGYGCVSGLVLVVTALVLPLSWLILVVAWQVLLFIYARRAKRIAVVGNLLISGIVASAFVGGGLLAGNLRAVVFPCVLTFLVVFGRELVKGAEDVEGDRRGGASTVAVRWGAVSSARLGSLVLFLAAMLAPTPALAGAYGKWYLGAMELLFVPGVILAGATVLRSARREGFRRASRLLKVQMLVGVAVLALAHL